MTRLFLMMIVKNNYDNMYKTGHMIKVGPGVIEVCKSGMSGEYVYLQVSHTYSH